MHSRSSLWNWTRYWISVSSLRETAHVGLLPANPPSDFRVLPAFTEERLIVLLGEPGSGKSIEIHKESERIRKQLEAGGRIMYLDGRTMIQSESALDRFWFRSDSWKDWQASSDDIWVFFDGFDESVQHIKGLSEIIRHELQQALGGDGQLASRLFLRIASRTTGWQPGLGDALSRLLNLDEREELARGQYTFHLAPPRWDDIGLAAESRGIDGREFCDRVREQGVEALVLRPAQLE